jgi:S-adenosylmethionine-diacylglycerol 3-amino-3-carboxypropyl transferase
MSSLSHVRLDLIRYANCWEDAGVLLRALAPLGGRRVLSIASGGDNSLALLSAGPASVVAVDVSTVQLFVTELKATAVRLLSREDYLAFAGFTPHDARWSTFRALAPALTPAARAWFEERRALIEHGLVHGGKLERYARFFAEKVLPLVHGRRRVEQLLAPKSAAAQLEFYDRVWDTPRWRWLFRLFFSRAVLGRFGRDPGFMQQVEVPVAEFLYRRMRAALSDPACTQNYMVRYFLTGSFGDDEQAWPLYVRPGVYERVQAHSDRLLLAPGYAEEAARRYGPFDRFNLSNIFEYMDEPTFGGAGAALLRHAAPDARLAYWNLMAPRRLARSLASRVAMDAPLRAQLRREDAGFFYGDFNVEQVYSPNSPSRR